MSHNGCRVHAPVRGTSDAHCPGAGQVRPCARLPLAARLLDGSYGHEWGALSNRARPCWLALNYLLSACALGAAAEYPGGPA